jgi:peroxiredoxin
MFRLFRKFGTDLRMTMLIMAAMVTFIVLQRHGSFLRGPATQTTDPDSRTRVAPDFTLSDLEGNLRRLSDFRGKVVLLNFWATWCPPCRAEMPSMEVLYQAYNNQGLEILAVASDVQGAAIVQPFMDGYHLSFPALLDTTGRVSGMYGVRSIPISYVLDRQGRIVSREIGARNWAHAEARALIVSLLSEPAQVPEDHAAQTSPLQ